MTVAFHVPSMGYAPRGIANQSLAAWEELDQRRHPYVFWLETVTPFPPEPPDGLFQAAELVARKRLGELEARVWLVGERLPRPKPANEAPANEAPANAEPGAAAER